MKCEKCKSKVKAKDKFCATCGEEIKRPKKRIPVGGIITVAILFLILIAIVASNSSNSPNLTPEQLAARAEARAAQQAERDKAQAEKEEEKRCSDQTMAFAMSQKFVKQRLKSPATAKFPYATNAGVQTQYLGNCTHRVRAFVDSQNSFGAMIRSTYTVKLKKQPSGNNWSLLDIQIE